ncbi:MAG: hypothetical protein AAF602_03855 [Myxococcota bacterium]
MRRALGTMLLAGCAMAEPTCSPVTARPVIEGPPASDPIWREDYTQPDWRPPEFGSEVVDAIPCPSYAVVRPLCSPDVAALAGGVGYPTVQDAIDGAEPDETVFVCAGSHPGPLRIEGRTLALRAVDSGQTTLFSRQVGPIVTLVDADVWIEGVGIEGGESLTGAAGLDASRSRVRVRCSSVRANVGFESAAGGIGLHASSLLLHTSRVLRNRASRAWGIVGTGEDGPLDLILVRSQFEGPGGGSRYTPAVQLTGREVRLQIRSTRFADEGAGEVGPGIRVEAAAVSVDIEDSVFENHRADETQMGAALWLVGSDVDLGVRGSEFVANDSAVAAGAIGVEAERANVFFFDTQLDDNAAPDAAAMLVEGSESTVLELRGGTLFRNRAGPGGAAIELPGDSTLVLQGAVLGSGIDDNVEHELAIGDEFIDGSGVTTLRRP